MLGIRDADWLYERKLDGMRVVAVRGKSGTRRDNTSTYPEIAGAITAAPRARRTWSRPAPRAGKA